ncbi:MAG TPA: histidine phosphatase family protein [Sandaracinaceae bacterium LLY-WYZ-13_1]|nr:histidine phosphatase family protein [Sandaracinaceae bacterium LLY-WYZ-13_1]
MRLLWVRHGQMAVRATTVDDPRAIDRFFDQEEQGSLSSRGRREAARVAARLADEGVVGLYSSPLIRARETAEVSAEALGLEVRVTDAINEVRTGKLRPGSPEQRWVRAMTASQLPPALRRPLLGLSLIPLYLHAWRTGRTVGGERPADVDARLAGFYRELEARHADRDAVALFSHGYLLVTLTFGLGLRGRAALLRRPYIPNGAICEMILRRGRLRLVRHADQRHLR